MKKHTSSTKAINPKAVQIAKSLFFEESILEIVVSCFKALGDVTRAKILFLLHRQTLCVRDIAILIGISESAISHQLNLLKRRKLVKAKRKGNVMYYSVAYKHLSRLLEEAENYADHVMQGLPDHE